MRDLLRDLRASLRALAHAPLTTAAAITVIAVGTGVNLAVFAVTYGVLMRPLPYPEASRLVILSAATPDGGDFGLPLSEIGEWQRRLRTVDGVAGFAEGELTVRGSGEPRLVRTAWVTEAFFDVLGAAPRRGRLEPFRESLDAAVLSERAIDYLIGASGASAGQVGESIRVGDATATVGAIMPPAFAFPSDTVEVWVRAPTSKASIDRAADRHKFRIVARLAPGVSLEQMRDDALRVLYEMRGLQQEAPGVGPLNVTRVEDAVVGGMRPVLGVSMAGAALVLLVTCGNVAMLLLGRASARRRESAVRLALGAGWWQLVRGSLIESLVLASAGSLLGVWLALMAVRIFTRAAAGVIPRAGAVAIDVPVLVASLVMVVAVAMLCGVAPALEVARRDFAAAFRGGVGELRTHRILTILVAGQIAVSVVLVASAGLLTQTFLRLLAEDTGVDSGGVLTARLSLGQGAASGAAQNVRFVDSLLGRVRALPGVRAAGVGSSLPPNGLPFQVYIHWRSETRDEGMRISVVSATPGFLEAVGARPIAGRLLTEADGTAEPPAILLSETASRFYSPDRDIVDRELPSSLPPMSSIDEPPRVAGVVEDVKYMGLDQPAAAAFYLPWSTRPTDKAFLVVRTDGDPSTLAAPVRRTLRELDEGMPVPAMLSLDDAAESSVADRRLRVIPALGFAAVALAVAVTGIFALFSRAVAERRRELAVRMALGATRSRVTAQVMRQAAVLTALGLVLGLAGSFWAANGLRSLLFGVGPSDAVTLAGSVVVVAVASLAAVWLPAQRAARVEPWELLRID